uniref:Uncharacterized protein n=1 Tax=Daphnia galeata TaxID=27404 RepID=A0A8J2RG00_9CRUS|nr:unnamed protein product [Daphnia galeata]
METSNRVVCGMVLGEASESDEDSDVPNNSTPASISFLPSNVNTKKTPKHRLKYNTLLHYRLRDSNIAVRNDMINIEEQITK